MEFAHPAVGLSSFSKLYWSELVVARRYAAPYFFVMRALFLISVCCCVAEAQSIRSTDIQFRNTVCVVAVVGESRQMQLQFRYPERVRVRCPGIGPTRDPSATSVRPARLLVADAGLRMRPRRYNVLQCRHRTQVERRFSCADWYAIAQTRNG